MNTEVIVEANSEAEAVERAAKILCPTKDAKLDLSRRYTLRDEHPCSFCDCNMPGATCPYKDKPADKIASICRTYLYFQLLQQYENQKFDKED